MDFRLIVVFSAIIGVPCISSSPLHNAKDDDPTVAMPDEDHARFKRAIPPVVAEKAAELGAQLAEKQLEILAEQQKKVGEFVNKKIDLDIAPQKGWETENLVVPSGMKVTVRESAGGNDKEPEAMSGQGASTYPFGVGGVLMNGCYGNGYKPGDPCFAPAWRTKSCLNLIDGATFIGVGFDVRGEYSPESRKMSIVQRSCAGKVTYDGFDVPDTINVQGIYDARGHMRTFFSRSEYQHYLQKQAGVAGSASGFYDGVKRAFGSSSLSGTQKYMAVFDLDIDRYEMHIDDVEPEDLSVGFLKEFMDLPLKNEDGDIYKKYQDFIQRWGTHYVKSAKFGGELEIRKTMEASEVQDKAEFSQTMEVEFRNIFQSYSAKAEEKEGTSSKSQALSSSLSFSVQGGSQDIALLITDIESPTFKQDMDNWLKSIPDYPKPYAFTIGPITDLLNFGQAALFKNHKKNWGCEAKRYSLVKDKISNRMYYTVKINGTETKKYCDYVDRVSLVRDFEMRQKALRASIEVYLEEGRISPSEFSIEPGKSGCQSKNAAFQSGAKQPTWKEITETEKVFKVLFDMEHEIENIDTRRTISPDSELFLRYRDGEWETSDDGHYFHFYDSCSHGKSGYPSSKKVCIRNLVLKYDGQAGRLKLDEEGFTLASQMFTPLEESWKGRTLATVEYSQEELFNMPDRVGYLPCNIKWSNVLQFRPSKSTGKCVGFAAASKGTIYVVFSAVPANPDTWYHVEISPGGVAILKSQKLKVSTFDQDAVSLGDSLLYEKYFVCFTEKDDSSVILEYGKVKADGETPFYLSFVDTEDTNTVRFYGFGSGEQAVHVVESTVVSRDFLATSCGGGAVSIDGRCVPVCHPLCDPGKGCRRTPGQDPKPTECNACLFYKLEDTGECVEECPAGYKQDDAGLCTVVSKNCQEWLDRGHENDGVYEVDPDGQGTFKVYCDQTTDGGGYTAFQHREDGSVYFYRGWDDYKNGFGNLISEFWLGLDKIHRLATQPQQLEIVLQDWEDRLTKRVVYDGFTVAGERDKYKMDLDKLAKDDDGAGDSLSKHKGMAFSTYDRDNDKEGSNCAEVYKGAWWYEACHKSNLNGLWGEHHKPGQGITWESFQGYRKFMKKTTMQIRPMK